MSRLTNKLLSLLFPHRCIACGRIMEEDGFCSECYLDAAEIHLSQSACGNYYDGLVPLYFYAGSVRRALLNMKFYRRPHIAEYFGYHLGQKLLLTYGANFFNAICFVPMSEHTHRKRYNQAEWLAKVIAEVLQTGILPAGLVKVRENQVQHKLNAAQRQENVSGVYAVWDSVQGKRVLLIDDIKTTGATLNECAKVLKAAGARSVVCAVVAISEKTGL